MLSYDIRKNETRKMDLREVEMDKDVLHLYVLGYVYV